MAEGMYVLVLCMVALGVRSAAGFQELKVAPKEISPGVTSSLTVNCTYTHIENADPPTHLVSIILSKSPRKDPVTLIELASMSVFSKQEIHRLSPIEAVTSGHIEKTGDSFLCLEWSAPSSEEAASYHCDANVLNTANGNVITNSEMAVVALDGDAEDDDDEMKEEF